MARAGSYRPAAAWSPSSLRGVLLPKAGPTLRPQPALRTRSSPPEQRPADPRQGTDRRARRRRASAAQRVALARRGAAGHQAAPTASASHRPAATRCPRSWRPGLLLPTAAAATLRPQLRALAQMGWSPPEKRPADPRPVTDRWARWRHASAAQRAAAVLGAAGRLQRRVLVGPPLLRLLRNAARRGAALALRGADHLQRQGHQAARSASASSPRTPRKCPSTSGGVRGSLQRSSASGRLRMRKPRSTRMCRWATDCCRRTSAWPSWKRCTCGRRTWTRSTGGFLSGARPCLRGNAPHSSSTPCSMSSGASNASRGHGYS